MEYDGKLYGKEGGAYFDTGRTTEDYDRRCVSNIGQLPDNICGYGGIYTKKGSDLLIDRDMSPDDLRAIARHMEFSDSLLIETPTK
jgi:hypothetical protein